MDNEQGRLGDRAGPSANIHDGSKICLSDYVGKRSLVLSEKWAACCVRRGFGLDRAGW
jgi:hypothetical protein